MANIGAWGSLGFYNAFLPEIAPPKRQDLLSAKGFSWGFDGSVLLLLLCLALIMGIGDHLDALGLHSRGHLVGRMVPNHLSQNADSSQERGRKAISSGRALENCGKVAQTLKGKTRITRYLLSFFVMSMAVQTIMLMASSFGIKEVKLADRRTDHRHHPGASRRHPRLLSVQLAVPKHWQRQSAPCRHVPMDGTCACLPTSLSTDPSCSSSRPASLDS